ncbi:putative Type II secretion system protein G (GspG) [Verrucomicrobia bacterium]|nr:putative Type II secretion system protein G (GspG) [Verrucomicrobiota bacterium]
MPRKIRTLLLALAAVLVLAVLAVLVLSGGRNPARSAPLPNPNGYDDFLKAAGLVTGDVGGFLTLDHEGLGALVSTNLESLRLVRLGLSRQCALPADSAMTNVAGMLSDLAALKRVAQLLVAEGRLREMDNRLADAAQSYVDAIHFGKEMSRGGFIINRLVGIACEAIGDNPLTKLVPKLHCEEARTVITELERIDRAGITWEEVRRNENSFSHYQLRKGFNPITWAMTRWQRWRSLQRAATRHNRVIAHERLLMVELALRCYESEQARAPLGLEQLVPQYLQGVPLDPFSGGPMIYHPRGTNWLLYSVGEDGADDGGKRVGRSVSGTVTKGDLFYDSPY